MSEASNFEVYIMVDENGDYVIAKEKDDLAGIYQDEIGESGLATRIVMVELEIPLPENQIFTLRGKVPSQSTQQDEPATLLNAE